MTDNVIGFFSSPRALDGQVEVPAVSDPDNSVRDGHVPKVVKVFTCPRHRKHVVHGVIPYRETLE